jgi:hypothetical protein
MDEKFDNPLKQILLDKMIDRGFFNPKDLHPSTIQTINDLTDSEILKLLKDFGFGPKVVKKDGGIVQLEKGGDPLLGQMIEKLKSKPKLASSTAAISDVISSLNEPPGTRVERETSKIANILAGSDVKRAMGPDLFEVFKDSGIKTAQIKAIANVPDVNDFVDDFDGFNKAMKKYRNTALKGLTKPQLDLIKSSGYLAGYAEQMRKDILEKGVTKKGKKFIVKPRYKNAIRIGKNGLPVITKAFENKYLDKNFDFVFEAKGTATGVDKPKTQSKIYSKIKEIGKNTLNKAQQFNLDLVLSQVDKIYKNSPEQAKKILKGIAEGVKTGRLFMGGPATFLGETIGMDMMESPEFQSVIANDPSLASFFGIQGEPQVFKDGGNVEKMVKKENPLLDVLRSRE